MLSRFIFYVKNYYFNDKTYKNLIFGSIWNSVANFVSRMSNFFSFVIISNLLGRVGFGELGMINSTIGTLGIFGGMGMGVAGSKFISEYREKDKLKAGSFIGIILMLSATCTIVISLILIIFRRTISYHLLGAPHLEKALLLSVFLLMANIFLGVLTGILSGFEDFKKLSIVNMIVSVISLPVIFIFSKYFKLYGAISGFSLSILINSLFIFGIITSRCKKENIKITFSNFNNYYKALLSFSLPMLISNLFSGGITWVCMVIVANTQNGYSEIGLYNAITQVRNIIFFIPTVISQVMIPVISNKLAEKNINDVKKIIKAGIISILILVLPLILVLGLFPNGIMYLYGKEFANSNCVFYLMLITSLLYCIQVAPASFYIASGKTNISLLYNIIWGVVMVILTYILREYGASGLYIAHLVAYSLIFYLFTIGTFNFLKRSY